MFIVRVNRFGCAEPGALLWAILLYGVSNSLYLMPVIRQMLGPWSELLASPLYLVSDALMAVLLYTWFNRIPESGTGYRWIWRQGRWILLSSYAWSLAVLLWANQAVILRADHRHFDALLILAAIDIAVLAYLLGSQRLRAVFAEFPEPIDPAEQRAAVKAKATARQQFVQEARLSASIARTAEQEAIETHWRAETLKEPDAALPWLELGVLAYQCGQVEQAQTLMERALDCEPQNPVVLRNLCELLRQQKRLSRAIEYGEQAVSLAPNDEITRLNLAQALVDDKKLDRAIAEYHRVLELNPQHVQTWMNLAVLLLKQGRKADAQAALEALLLIDPGNEQVIVLRNQMSI